VNRANVRIKLGIAALLCDGDVDFDAPDVMMGLRGSPNTFLLILMKTGTNLSIL